MVAEVFLPLGLHVRPLLRQHVDLVVQLLGALHVGNAVVDLLSHLLLVFVVLSLVPLEVRQSSLQWFEDVRKHDAHLRVHLVEQLRRRHHVERVLGHGLERHRLLERDLLQLPQRVRGDRHAARRVFLAGRLRGRLLAAVFARAGAGAGLGGLAAAAALVLGEGAPLAGALVVVVSEGAVEADNFPGRWILRKLVSITTFLQVP